MIIKYPIVSVVYNACSRTSVTHAAETNHRHPLPLPEDLMRKLGGGYDFTKVDLADAYKPDQARSTQPATSGIEYSFRSGFLLASSQHLGIFIR